MSSLQNNKLPKNILFIPSGSIGDALMMIALCGEILQYQPHSRVTIIARRNGKLIHDLAKAYPRIRTVIIEKTLGGALTLVWESFKRRYVALMPAGFGISSVWNTELFFRFLSLRPGNITAGLLKKKGDADPYQCSLVYELQLLHFDNLRRLATLAGLEVKPEGMPVLIELSTTPSSILQLQTGHYIVYHPFGSSSWKSVSPRRSKILLTWLRATYPDMSIVITGAKENETEAREICASVSNTQVLIDQPILEVADIIKNAVLYIGVDTGITHVAGLLHAKSIILGHNTAPSWMVTYNPNAVILKNNKNCTCDGDKGGDCKVMEDGKPYLRCLYDIEDSQIHTAVDSFLHAKI